MSLGTLAKKDDPMSDLGPGHNSGQEPVTAGKDTDTHSDYYRDDFGQFASKPDPVGLSLSAGLLPVNEPNPEPTSMQVNDAIGLTETEASVFMKGLRHVLNAAANASDLAKKVAEIEGMLQAMKDDINVYRSTIASQDRELAQLRMERVDLQRENAEVRAENASQAVEIVRIIEDRNTIAKSFDQLQVAHLAQIGESERLLRERDEALTKQLELEHKLTLAEQNRDHFERECADARAALERVRTAIKPQLAAA